MVVSSSKSVMSATVLRRLKKSTSSVGSIPTFRIVVFGQSGVGKTAMSVRFVTKRFIGEYDSTVETVYQHYCSVGGSTVLFEIMDNAGKEENDVAMEEKIRWADAFLLVYAVNDLASFNEILGLKFTISKSISQHKQNQPEPVITIVGNKTDLKSDREVKTEAGEGLANGMSCGFTEISVRDNVNEVSEVFEDIYEAYKYRVTVFNAINESNGTLSRRKHKSFKYVDRIPRMQGKKQNLSPFDEHNGRSQHGNDTTPSAMTTKFDDDSDRIVRGLSSLARAHSHSYSRSTLSLPADLASNASSPTENGDIRRPLRRRNAVIAALGSSNSLQSYDQHSSDEEKPRKPMRTIYAGRCIPESYDEDEDSQVFDNNNNANVRKTNRRCLSQDNFGLGRKHPLETMAKNAVSFDSSTSMSRRVS